MGAPGDYPGALFFIFATENTEDTEEDKKCKPKIDCFTTKAPRHEERQSNLHKESKSAWRSAGSVISAKAGIHSCSIKMSYAFPVVPRVPRGEKILHRCFLGVLVP